MATDPRAALVGGEERSLMDLFDWLVIVGIGILGLALWLVWGWVAVLAYVGVLAVVVGLVGAMLREEADDGNNQQDSQ